MARRSRRRRRPQPTTDRRSPEERLEAMVREKDLDRAHRMFARILDDLDAKPEPGPWVSGARTLSERLIISDDAFHYLVEKLTECLVYVGSFSDPELVRIYAAMQEIERAHGLREDEFWTRDEAPEEWRALEREWSQRADALVDTALREYGHGDVADLRERDRDDYDARSERGHIDIWGNDQDEDFD